jgi:hypothetical protein
MKTQKSPSNKHEIEKPRNTKSAGWDRKKRKRDCFVEYLFIYRSELYRSELYIYLFLQRFDFFTVAVVATVTRQKNCCEEEDAVRK